MRQWELRKQVSPWFLPWLLSMTNCDLEVEAKRNPCTLSCFWWGCFIAEQKHDLVPWEESLKCIWGWEATLQRGHVCLAPSLLLPTVSCPAPYKGKDLLSHMPAQGCPSSPEVLEFVELAWLPERLTHRALCVQASALSRVTVPIDTAGKSRGPSTAWDEASTDRCQVLVEELWGGKWTE